MRRPLISVCIVTGRRGRLLDACLASLQRQVEAPAFELLVTADRDDAVADTVRERFPDAVIVAVRRGHPGAARNPLIERARGELLLFLDDDVTVRPDLLARLGELSAVNPDTAVFGGPNLTPRGSSRFQVVQGAVLSSLIGSGPVRRRYGAHPPGLADERWFTLCNLAVRRSAMEPFAEDLVCAEENAVLIELRRRHLPMLYDPSLVAYHERRPSVAGFARQMRKYGHGRGQLLARRLADLPAAYLIPAALVAYLVSLPVLMMVAAGWALAPLALYAGLVAAGAVQVAASLRSPGVGPTAALLLVVLHVSYGIGVIGGIAARRRPRRAAPSPPRGRGAARTG